MLMYLLNFLYCFNVPTHQCERDNTNLFRKCSCIANVKFSIGKTALNWLCSSLCCYINTSQSWIDLEILKANKTCKYIIGFALNIIAPEFILKHGQRVQHGTFIRFIVITWDWLENIHRWIASHYFYFVDFYASGNFLLDNELKTSKNCAEVVACIKRKMFTSIWSIRSCYSLKYIGLFKVFFIIRKYISIRYGTCHKISIFQDFPLLPTNV